MLQRRPIVVIACCFVIGVLFGATLSAGAALIAALGLVLILPLCCRLKWCSWRLSVLYALTLLLAVTYFIWSVQLDRSYWSESHGEGASTEEQVAIWNGFISSPVERDGDRVQFHFMSTDWKSTEMNKPAPVREKLLVQVRLHVKQEIEAAAQWKRGQQVQISGTLSLPGEATNFGAFSYRDYLRTARIHWIVKVSGAERVTDAASEAAISPLDIQWTIQKMLAYIDGLREHLSGLLQRLYEQPHSGYVQGLILGSRRDLDPDTYQQFSELGLTHVLAISGLHVGVFVGALLGMFRLLRMTKETSIAAVLWLIPFYVLLTGAAASVVRAGMMSMAALYGLRRGWLKDGLHILSAALLLMLLWQPRYALQVGFQLSFIVTAGLIVFVPHVVRLLPAWPSWLTSSIAVTLVAQAVSFPVTVYYFNQFSLLSFGANFLLVPFISMGVLPLGTISLLAAAIYEPLARPVAWIVERMNDLTFTIVQRLSLIEGTTVIWPTPHIWWIIVYYVSLSLLIISMVRWMNTYRLQRRLHRQAGSASEDTQPLDTFIMLRSVTPRFVLSGLLGASLLFGTIIYTGYHRERSLDAAISIIDVGQGDSILIRTATGRHILIDGGGTVNFRKPADRWRDRRVPFEIGEKVVVPLLKQRGVRSLDAVVLTHADQDHAGGLQAVLEQIPTKRFVMNGTWKSSASMHSLYRTALQKQIPIIKWGLGDTWSLDAWTQIKVLYPEASSAGNHISTSDQQNDSSIVLHVTLTHPRSKEQSSILLTGDLEADGEQMMLTNSGMYESLSIDVLKVAHHGSKTSTTPEWLQAWQPRLAVISAGRNNRYGHPHPLVLEALSQANVPVLRTDLNGEVQFKLTGSGLKVRKKHDRIFP